jgi:hypothetical protein
MSLSFADVLTGMTTNFAAELGDALLQRRHRADVGLLRTVNHQSQCVVVKGANLPLGQGESAMDRPRSAHRASLAQVTADHSGRRSGHGDQPEFGRRGQ